MENKDFINILESQLEHAVGIDVRYHLEQLIIALRDYENAK